MKIYLVRDFINDEVYQEIMVSASNEKNALRDAVVQVESDPFDDNGEFRHDNFADWEVEEIQSHKAERIFSEKLKGKHPELTIYIN